MNSNSIEIPPYTDSEANTFFIENNKVMIRAANGDIQLIGALRIEGPQLDLTLLPAESPFL
jgi:hypothetical protein